MVSHVPQSSYEELAEYLGDEDEKTTFDEATNTKVTSRRIEDGYEQVIIVKEWVNDKIGKRTTTCVRTYKAPIEEEEEFEEEGEEIPIDDETLAKLRADAPPMPEPEIIEGKDGKKKKKKQKIEGTADTIRETFEGGYKEITTVKFPDGTHRISTKFFYDPVPIPKSETQVIEETQTSKSGKKKKVKKIVNLNQEILQEYTDDDGNLVIVAREMFPDGTGHKDITTTKMKNGQQKMTCYIITYPKDKEIIETTEIIEHPPDAIRMTVKETIMRNTFHMDEETIEKSSSTTTSSKKTKKSSKKVVESSGSIDQQVVEAQQVQQVSQEVSQVSAQQQQQVKVTKKSTKKLTDEQQRLAVLDRDNSEGVTTVVREKTEKGYREISTTVFADGSTKTATREFYDAVEESVDPKTAMEMREKMAALASQPPQEQKNADGSVSVIVTERIANGYRQTTTTKKQNGATSVRTQEFYDPTEEEVTESTKRRVVSSKQQIQGVQNNTMKSVKLFG
jgi:hypothetical protein